MGNNGHYLENRKADTSKRKMVSCLLLHSSLVLIEGLRSSIKWPLGVRGCGSPQAVDARMVTLSIESDSQLCLCSDTFAAGIKCSMKQVRICQAVFPT